MQLRIIPKKAGRDNGGHAIPADALRARGKRLTRPRRLILDLVRGTDAHPSAAVVYREVRRHLPRVSLATVYRNLRMLAAEGLLSERAEAGGTRFDGNTDPHDHFTCVACGRIYDVPPLGARRVAPRATFRPGSRCRSAHRILWPLRHLPPRLHPRAKEELCQGKASRALRASRI